jgi:hypothetical protein
VADFGPLRFQGVLQEKRWSHRSKVLLTVLLRRRPRIYRERPPCCALTGGAATAIASTIIPSRAAFLRVILIFHYGVVVFVVVPV